MDRLDRYFIIGGWLVPVLVIGWFKFVMLPGDSEDNGWAFLALISVGLALAAGWILLLLGVIGVTRTSDKQLPDRVLIGFGAVGLCLYSLVLFAGAIFFVPT